MDVSFSSDRLRQTTISEGNETERKVDRNFRRQKNATASNYSGIGRERGGCN